VCQGAPIARHQGFFQTRAMTLLSTFKHGLVGINQVNVFCGLRSPSPFYPATALPVRLSFASSNMNSYCSFIGTK